jgi:hypothetical protein
MNLDEHLRESETSRRLAWQVLQEIRLVLEVLGDQRMPYHALFPLLSGMRGVMNVSLGKSGFVFDRAEKLVRFAGQGLVILTGGARIAGEKSGDDLSHRQRSLGFIQWHNLFSFW